MEFGNCFLEVPGDTLRRLACKNVHRFGEIARQTAPCLGNVFSGLLKSRHFLHELFIQDALLSPAFNGRLVYSEARSKKVLGLIDIAGQQSLYFRPHLYKRDTHRLHGLSCGNGELGDLLKFQPGIHRSAHHVLHALHKFLCGRCRLKAEPLYLLHHVRCYGLGCGVFLGAFQSAALFVLELRHGGYQGGHADAALFDGGVELDAALDKALHAFKSFVSPH